MARPIKTMNPEKKRFMALLKKQGFRSINQFAIACGMPSGNVHLNLSGVYAVTVERAFRYANTLGVPVDEVLDAFYHKEMVNNERAVEKFHIPVDE